MIGRPLSVIFPSDRINEEASILAAVGRGEGIARHETTRLTKDGRVIRVAATVTPILDTGGRIMGASTI
jgi:PAS domain S-box-containing protein